MKNKFRVKKINKSKYMFIVEGYGGLDYRLCKNGIIGHKSSNSNIAKFQQLQLKTI